MNVDVRGGIGACVCVASAAAAAVAVAVAAAIREATRECGEGGDGGEGQGEVVYAWPRKTRRVELNPTVALSATRRVATPHARAKTSERERAIGQWLS